MKTVDYFHIIHKYIPNDSRAYHFYIPHVVLVTQKALAIARALQLSEESIQFIEEAGMLHDIGIHLVDAPDIGCLGDSPYICHGYLGKEILEKEGLSDHALVAERHTGVGISKDDIQAQKLPLPVRDMLPITVEEQIICYADIWYSKNPERLWIPYSIIQIHQWFGRYPHGQEKIDQFEKWRLEFEPHFQ